MLSYSFCHSLAFFKLSLQFPSHLHTILFNYELQIQQSSNVIIANISKYCNNVQMVPVIVRVLGTTYAILSPPFHSLSSLHFYKGAKLCINYQFLWPKEGESAISNRYHVQPGSSSHLCNILELTANVSMLYVFFAIFSPFQHQKSLKRARRKNFPEEEESSTYVRLLSYIFIS